MSIAEYENEQQESPGGAVGFVTRPAQSLAPAMLAEQQRAKSEIEAALTIAAARPRDEKECLDGILVSCQRPGVAEKAQYRYSRGGTDITGPTIDLMEVIAQKWGNIEFGFRELARYPGVGGGAGESVVEAFAWDLETNTRRKVQFTVRHIRDKRSGNIALRDERDIYEMIANNAQRRVRTCLENIIPRDIVESACNQANTTLKANCPVNAETLKKLLDAFSGFKVTKEMIEARIQRRLDAMQPAQMVAMRQIYSSLKDGMSEVSEWFTVEESEKPKSAAESAKDKMRQRKQEAPVAEQTTEEPFTLTPEVATEVQSDDPFLAYQDALAKCPAAAGCNKLHKDFVASNPEDTHADAELALKARLEEIKK